MARRRRSRKSSSNSKKSTPRPQVKPKAKSTPTSRSKIIYNNLIFLIVIFTSIMFNFLKHNFFEGRTINFMELFFMIISTTLVFSMTLSKICGSNYHSKFYLQHPFQNSMILLLIFNAFRMINPFKSLPYLFSNLLSVAILVIGYNGLMFMANKNKANSCKIKSKFLINVFLTVLNIGLVYFNKN